MTIDEIRSSVAVKMDQSIAAFKNNLTKIRTGRANPALLDSVQVDYYGANFRQVVLEGGNRLVHLDRDAASDLINRHFSSSDLRDHLFSTM